jgi:hypothetical protein
LANVALPFVITYFGIGWKTNGAAYACPEVSAQLMNAFSAGA